jgi:serine/threonine protein kinase
MTSPTGGLDGTATRTSVASETLAAASVAPDTLLSDPAICERYRVVKMIAHEPEDALYLARRLDTDALVEIWVLTGSLGADRVLLTALAQHATLVARISGECPGIAAVHACERTSRGLVLVIEHPEGPTLREVIQRDGALGLTRALRLALGIAKVLERVHNLSLAHGGLRPENVVLVGAEEEVVLTHFGFDWVLSSRSPDAGRRRAAATEHSAYRAPEQEWDQTSPRSDIFAFGAILYEMLLGAPPPSAGASRPHGNSEPLSSRRADVTTGLEHIVTQALQVAPERRLADISAIINALTIEISTDRSPEPAERQTVGQPSHGTTKKVAAWGSVAVLVVLAIWLAHGRMRQDIWSGLLPRSTPSASTPGTPADEVPTRTTPADSRPPDIARRPTDQPGADPPASREASPSMVRTMPGEQSGGVRDVDKPRSSVAPVPTTIRPQGPEPPKAMVPQAKRADEGATDQQRDAAAARQLEPSRETREATDDPGAIIDWPLNEGAGKER